MSAFVFPGVAITHFDCESKTRGNILKGEFVLPVSCITRSVVTACLLAYRDHQQMALTMGWVCSQPLVP